MPVLQAVALPFMLQHQPLPWSFFFIKNYIRRTNFMFFIYAAFKINFLVPFPMNFSKYPHAAILYNCPSRQFCAHGNRIHLHEFQLFVHTAEWQDETTMITGLAWCLFKRLQSKANMCLVESQVNSGQAQPRRNSRDSVFSGPGAAVRSQVFWRWGLWGAVRVGWGQQGEVLLGGLVPTSNAGTRTSPSWEVQWGGGHLWGEGKACPP